VTDDDLCPMSDLPPDQCALPCHRNVNLPAGFAPEVRRGVEPTGFSTSLTPPAAEQHEPRDTRPRPVKPKRPKTACRYVGDDWMTREHLHGCDDRACEGCKPCPKDHCALFGCPSHVNVDAGIITCPSCIGEFREVVAEVEALTALLSVELEHATTVEHAVTGPLSPIWTFRDITDVATLAGPYAAPDQVDARETARGWCEWPRIIHPLDVLDRLERDLRVEYEQPPADESEARWPMPLGEQVNVLTRTCAYLTRMLDGRFPHDEPFERTFRELKKLRVHLEGVMSDSRKPETGVQCPTCAGAGRKAQPLVKHHGHWCDDPKCKREHVSTVTGKDGIERPDTSRDEWVCPTNGDHKWSDEDYRKFVEGAYLAHAERLTTRQIGEQYGIPQGTIRRWAATTKRDVDGESVEVAPKLRPAGKTQRGVLLYRVADVLALRARETREKEAAEA
jgi:hypothetical protein